MSQLDEDDRLLPILHRLVHEDSQSNEGINSSGRMIKPEQIDEVRLTFGTSHCLLLVVFSCLDLRSPSACVSFTIDFVPIITCDTLLGNSMDCS